MNLLLAQTLLRALGCETETVSDGATCLGRVAQSPPDLVLLDVMMPGIDGFEVCRRLKNDENLRHIPVVLLTALQSVEDRVAGAEAGADDFISKPFNRHELSARVRSLLQNKRFRDQEIDYLREVRRLTAAAAAIEAADFDASSLDDLAGRNDDLGRLARVFQKMAREVESRERSLQQQVDRLKIEIDVGKRNREVAQITESEYFQRLRNRAVEIRTGTGDASAEC